MEECSPTRAHLGAGLLLLWPPGECTARPSSTEAPPAQQPELASAQCERQRRRLESGGVSGHQHHLGAAPADAAAVQPPQAPDRRWRPHRHLRFGDSGGGARALLLGACALLALLSAPLSTLATEFAPYCNTYSESPVNLGQPCPMCNYADGVAGCSVRVVWLAAGWAARMVEVAVAHLVAVLGRRRPPLCVPCRAARVQKVVTADNFYRNPSMCTLPNTPDFRGAVPSRGRELLGALRSTRSTESSPSVRSLAACA